MQTLNMTFNAKSLAEHFNAPAVNLLAHKDAAKVDALFDIANALNSNVTYTLYAFDNEQNELIYSNNDQIIAPLKANEILTDEGLVHHVLTLNDQAIGELIIKYSPPLLSLSPRGVLISTYIALLIALLTLYVLALIFKNYIVKQINRNALSLSNDIKSVTDNNNYTSRLNEQLGDGLDKVARQINLLLKKVSGDLENNETTQNELKALQSSLESEVQNRTFALEKQTEKALRASEAKTTFLATMSHEIRTPMNGVIGTIDLLRQTELDGSQQRLSTIIRESAFSLLSILDDILDFSKIEAGKLNIDPVPFSVADTIEEVAKVLSAVAKKRHLDLELAIAPDIPSNLVGDTVRVRQVLYNLCSNAIKFTSTDSGHQGKVKISVEVAHNTAEHFTLRFCVVDNGKGMNQAQIREVFNPFTQAENSITREYGGTGLGLSICKSLTELMLGTIHVNSHIGIGSEFTIELPFNTTGQIEFAHKNTLNAKRVAIIGHNIERKKTIYRYLAFMGANITYIENELEIEKYQNTPDLIWIMDAIDDMDSANSLLRKLLHSMEDNNQQMVVLSKLDEAVINHTRVYYINASPLCKSNFMYSVLVAAGVHKPKLRKKQPRPVNTMSNQQALAANKLILLVEDNLLNQEVLSEQLRILGYTVSVANDGEEGLNMWRKNSYSLILTDLHMPNMSGYDMVEKMRSEAELLESIDAQPYVIAVTANALKGEKERCLNVGINDFITKPVELNILEETINRWKDKYKQSDSSLNITTQCPIDMSSADKYTNNDQEKKIRFFKMYLEQSHEQIKAINFAVLQSNQDAIAAACHQLKSISRTIGANTVADLTEKFETQCKTADLSTDDLISLRNELEVEYSKAAQFLKEHIKNNEHHDPLS